MDAAGRTCGRHIKFWCGFWYLQMTVPCNPINRLRCPSVCHSLRSRQTDGHCIAVSASCLAGYRAAVNSGSRESGSFAGRSPSHCGGSMRYAVTVTPEMAFSDGHSVLEIRISLSADLDFLHRATGAVAMQAPRAWPADLRRAPPGGPVRSATARAHVDTRPSPASD